jgi:hypothetical protein
MPAFTAINPGRFGPNLCADLMSCSCVLCGNGRLNKASTAFACEAYVLLLLFVVNFVVVVVLAKMAIGVDDDFDENDSDASFKATEEENDDDFDVDAKTEPHTLLILVAFNSAAEASAEAAAAEGFVAAAARLNMMPSIGGFFCGAFSENKIDFDFCFRLFPNFLFLLFFSFFVVLFTSLNTKATRKVKLFLVVF